MGTNLIARSQCYEDSREFGTFLHLPIKKQIQLSLLTILKMTVEWRKSCFLERNKDVF